MYICICIWVCMYTPTFFFITGYGLRLRPCLAQPVHRWKSLQHDERVNSIYIERERERASEREREMCVCACVRMYTCVCVGLSRYTTKPSFCIIGHRFRLRSCLDQSHDRRQPLQRDEQIYIYICVYVYMYMYV